MLHGFNYQRSQFGCIGTRLGSHLLVVIGYFIFSVEEIDDFVSQFAALLLEHLEFISFCHIVMVFLVVLFQVILYKCFHCFV